MQGRACARLSVGLGGRFNGRIARRERQMHRVNGGQLLGLLRRSLALGGLVCALLDRWEVDVEGRGFDSLGWRPLL